jgi:hypothetical protein
MTGRQIMVPQSPAPFADFVMLGENAIHGMALAAAEI